MATKTTGEDVKVLESKIRPITEKDKGLQRFSYSKLEKFIKCPMAYDLRYNQGKYAEQKAIHLDLGTLCHKLLELEANRLIAIKNQYTYNIAFYESNWFEDVMTNGITEKTAKGEEKVLGLKDIKKRFAFTDFIIADEATGMSYNQKLALFKDTVFPNMFKDETWFPVEAEKEFEFVYNYGTAEEPKEVILYGFIDRMDSNANGEYRVVDYKTSKKIFSEADTKTSKQMGIYALACYMMNGVLPSEFQYNFVFLDKTQLAMTKGWLKRLIKALDKTFTEIEECKKADKYCPKPTPLCHWCDYCKTNEAADARYVDDCEYYSLWTPTNKTFATNRAYMGSNTNSNTNSIIDSMNTINTNSKTKKKAQININITPSTNEKLNKVRNALWF